MVRPASRYSRTAAWLLPVWLVLHAAAATLLPPLAFIVSTTNSAPLQLYANGEPSGGIIQDISVEIAHRLGYEARFVVTARKRIDEDLRDGRADVVCYATPQWVQEPLVWTTPFIPNAEVIVMRRGAPVISTLDDLRGKTLGTVRGYAYPQLPNSADNSITRDDAPNVQTNIQKMLAGRTQYAIVDSLTLAYEARSYPQLKTLPTLATSQFKAQCGFSSRVKLPIAQINSVIAAMQRDGELERILARYR